MNKQQNKTIKQIEETLTEQYCSKEAYEKHLIAEQKGIKYNKTSLY